MKILKKDVVVTSVTLSKSKKTNEPYLIVNFLDTEDGSQYSVLEKNIELLQKIQPMNKWKVDVTVTSSAKFGLRIEITNWIEKIGQV